MIAIQIPCTPLVRRCLERQYGPQPISINNTVVFDLVTTARSSDLRITTFTDQVTLLLCAPYAASVKAAPARAAKALDRYFKDQMCWYAVAVCNTAGFGHAKPAIQQWLDLHGVTEDDLSIETAYKIWQRFGWELQKKSGKNAVQIRNKAADNLNQKKRRSFKWAKTRNQRPVPDRELETIMAQFSTEYMRIYKRMPKKLPEHLRIYIYVTRSGASQRDAADRFGRYLSVITYALRTVRRQMQRSQHLRSLVHQYCDLPAATV